MNVNEILNSQRKQYREILTTGKITIPANSETIVEVKISTLGAFACKKITGSYTTLELDGADIVDLGINKTSIALQDGANSLPLTNDFVDTDMILSCGRVRSALATNNATTAPAPSFLFEPLEFSYTFASMSSIQIKVKNISDTANQVNLAFHGYRLRA